MSPDVLPSYGLHAYVLLCDSSEICFPFVITVAAKGESEPERKETRSKVDEDRKHEYPFVVTNIYIYVCVYIIRY